MRRSLVLTAPPGTLTLACISIAAQHTGSQPKWLSASTACEYPEVEPSIVEPLRADLAPHRIDVNLIGPEPRRKNLLIADMDSTIISCECIDEIADFAGIKAQIAAITEQAMNGEVPFDTALKERVSLLKGLPQSILHQVFDQRVRLNPGAKTLIATMNKLGAVTALVSGGFTFFTERVAALAGFASHQANDLVFEGGKLSGQVRNPILGRSAKRDALLRLAQTHKLNLSETLAIGDGANDLEMIVSAGLGIAFHAKPIVAQAAPVRIDYCDLTAALHLQGIKEADWVKN